MKQFNRVFARVDLDAVSYNMEQMRRRIGEGAQIIAVIKMDGYGHGAVPIAEMFEEKDYIWATPPQAWRRLQLSGRKGLKNQFSYSAVFSRSSMRR